jgi:hypothetical protein
MVAGLLKLLLLKCLFSYKSPKNLAKMQILVQERRDMA